jgi:hypothetical protein
LKEPLRYVKLLSLKLPVFILFTLLKTLDVVVADGVKANNIKSI